jgi:hypothetical protein
MFGVQRSAFSAGVRRNVADPGSDCETQIGILEHEASFAPLRRARSALNYRPVRDESDFGRDAGFAESGRILNFGV